eukprot:CAMPEP_0180707546 /NCGR_PEP_ID=MMETSP1038_2-20121128/8773_1 /TAXON_ID=632150 /ORGANISM="Azadinium spinosum, Strain 3D9" /LENGTH=79 /DNA_ID=CAMNT_0022739505 /DNA_START=600 /DNA_END=836 /DNA_ORIENTATION=-
MTGAQFMYRGARGKVYSFEKCRKHEVSGFTVGAQKPPHKGMLYTKNDGEEGSQTPACVSGALSSDSDSSSESKFPSSSR